MFRRTLTSLVPLALLLVVGQTACSGIEPLVGDWVSTDKIGGANNEMEIDEDLTGDATVYFYFDDSVYYDEFDLEATVLEKRVYEIEFESDTDNDFDMTVECEVNSEGDELDCQHEDGDFWESYVDGGGLDWEFD